MNSSSSHREAAEAAGANKINLYFQGSQEELSNQGEASQRRNVYEQLYDALREELRTFVHAEF